MRVHVHPADLGGCGHYRLIWPAKALQAQGADVVLNLPFTDEASVQAEADFMRWALGNEVHLTSLKTVPDCDVVVLQRPLDSRLVQCIPLLQRAGVAVVVELDDDFSSIHPRNSAFWPCHPKTNPRANYLHLQEACRLADLVTVSTPALADRFAGHGRVAVLENRVPRCYFDTPRKPHDDVRVGWSGTVATHPTDLQVGAAGIVRALQRRGLLFHVIGGGEGVAEALGVDKVATTGGFLHLERYPEGMAALDVGVVPLDDTAFNRAKSWLKGLEFAAVGTPFVASPTPEYMRLGAGLLADKPKHWERMVGRLVDDEAFRTELAEYGRETARRWVVEDAGHLWWEAWERALRNRRAKAAA